MSAVFVRVALDNPLPTLFDYRYDLAPEPVPGLLVRVPFGRRDAVGLICEVTAQTDVPADKLRAVEAICDACPPLSGQWRALAGFAAEYYQRGLGEVALLPGEGGIFEVRADGEKVWSRSERGRFLEIKELKQLVRDVVSPGKSLGHSDTPVHHGEE